MEREQELEGRLLDDEFLEEVAREAEKAGGLSQIGPESQIPKPFAWKTNLGVYSMKSNFGAALNLFCMIAGVSLAGVFAGEKSRFTPSSSAPEAPSEASWSYMRCRL